MLKISLKRVTGYTDVSVITKVVESNPELDWVSDQVSAGRKARNVCMFPFCLTNPLEDNITYLGPTLAASPELFTTSPVYPGPILKNSVLITVMNENDSVVREHFCTVPWAGLIKDGQVKINPGEEIFTSANQAFFDKTELPNSIPPAGRIFYLSFEFNPLGWINEAYCNSVTPCRFGSSQIRHGTEVDVL